MNRRPNAAIAISGMVMRAQTLLWINPHPTDDEIRQHMRPNLCRCGTHAAIIARSSAWPRHKGGTVINASHAPSCRDLLAGAGAVVVAFSLARSRSEAIAQDLPAPKSVALIEVDSFLASMKRGW
jgi:xanthine dehydrogenase iron-sulfur cluster and FAD-binding subunit A